MAEEGGGKEKGVVVKTTYTVLARNEKGLYLGTSYIGDDDRSHPVVVNLPKPYPVRGQDLHVELTGSGGRADFKVARVEGTAVFVDPVTEKKQEKGEAKIPKINLVIDDKRLEK